MLKAIEIKPDVFWVGGIDWNERNFHGYTTERGSTYNAYLILDEKITLIDTCKKPFTGELIDRIADITDPASISCRTTWKWIIPAAFRLWLKSPRQPPSSPARPRASRGFAPITGTVLTSWA